MRSSTIETSHHMISLLMAKPRTAQELARLCECSRVTIWRHLGSMQAHALVKHADGFYTFAARAA